MKWLAIFTVVLAFVVVTLGAYVRLSDAGLGCPDWPGCYGHMVVPAQTELIDQANLAYPERPMHQAKAWKEMLHRYVAGFLGLCILALAIGAWRQRDKNELSLWLPFGLLALVIFQALLGMWTVTLLLKPAIVVAHLLGGMTILLLLWWLCLSLWRPQPVVSATPRFSRLILAGLAVLYIQIMLGGWTSANYAALVCSDLPMCQGQWWPPMDFNEGFTLWRGVGQDYEGGVLAVDARTAIHVAHRIGAVVTTLLLLVVALRSLVAGSAIIPAVAVLILLAGQVTLGVMNIVHVLPLPVAVAHNGGAALLLLSVATLLYYSRTQKFTV